MSLLRKVPYKTLNSLSILITPARCFTSQNPNLKPFPDEPTSAYYDELVQYAGQSRDFNALRDLLNKRISDGCFNTKRTFNFIINTDASLSVLDDLVQTIAGLNKGATRKSAFDSLIARLCRLKRVEESLRVVDAMTCGCCGLNASTFYPILDVLTREKTMEKAWLVVDLMRKLNVPLDLTVYNHFLMSYCVSGDLKAAAGMLMKIEEEEGMSADTRTYDALVRGACKAGQVEGALMLVRRMIKVGVPMLWSTHISVMDALLHLQCYEQAVTYVMSFSGKDKNGDTQIIGCLADRLIKLKKFEEAKMVLEEMNKLGLRMGDKLKDFYHVRNAKFRSNA